MFSSSSYQSRRPASQSGQAYKSSNPITHEANQIPYNQDNDSHFQKSYFSPYVNGKRNNGFVHPSFVSNQVFYHQGSNEVQNEDNGKFKRTRNNFQSFDQSQAPREAFQKEEREERDYYSPEKQNRRKDQNYNNRDDSPETLTVVSTLSSNEYICPHCLNRHLRDDQRSKCWAERQKDVEGERRIAEMNHRKTEEEEAQRRQERARRLDEGRNLKEKLENDYQSRLEVRRSPPKEKANAMQGIFQKQDEFVEKQKQMYQTYSQSLKEQLRNESQKKQKEREDNYSSYSTSLQIGEGYHNKYLKNTNPVTSTLKEQVEERAYKERRERELDRRVAQQTSEKGLKEQEQDEQRRREKEWKQKMELKEHLLKSMEEKKNKEVEEKLTKNFERSLLDRDYLEFKKRQAEEEAMTKKRIMEFNRDQPNQHEYSSSKKQYEDRRGHTEVTSFDPPSKTKKMYPCGECNNLYEKPYLTKYH